MKAKHLYTSTKKHLVFEHYLQKGKKTITVLVKNKHQTDLGSIKWFSHWRRYCFFPHPFHETLFDLDCLDIIAGVISDLMRSRSSLICVRKSK